MFSPNDYLDLARALNGSAHDDGLREARQRSAISRAYYSIFICARNKRCESNAPHGTVFKTYKSAKDRASVSLGNRLEALYRDRCNADYGDYLQDPELKAEEVIAETEALHKLLAGL